MRIALATVVAVLISCLHIVAQAPLTLEAAQAEARARAPEVLALDAGIRSAEAVAAQAQRTLRQNPEVSGSIGPGAFVGRSDELSWSVGISQPVDVSGSWKPRSASANADVVRAHRERDDGVRALDERVAVAVADLALQQQIVRRLEQVTTLQQIAADGARRQLEVGQGSQLDADSAALDLAAARVAIEQARGDLASARARLGRLLARPASADLVVGDPAEIPQRSEPPSLNELVEQDPRVRAAAAELDAAKFEQQMFEKLVTPAPSFGVAYAYQRRGIPAGSFSGAPFANSLSALWPDRELTFNVTWGLPFFDRQQEPYARATGRTLTAEAKLASARADVQTELSTAWESLQAASRGLEAVSSMTSTIDRDITFVERAVRAGAFDAVQRTQALRRLVEAGRVADTAVRDFRTARAGWIRQTAR